MDAANKFWGGGEREYRGTALALKDAVRKAGFEIAKTLNLNLHPYIATFMKCAFASVDLDLPVSKMG